MTALTRNLELSILLQYKDWEAAKEHRRKHAEPTAPIQPLHKVTLGTATLTPDATPKASQVAIPSGVGSLGHSHTEPIELVYTLQGRKWIMFYSTETAAGFKEAIHSWPNWISNT